MESLKIIAEESPSIIKIVLSSRDDSNIFAHFADASKLRVTEADTRQDMELYVQHRVSAAIRQRALLDGIVPDRLRVDMINFLPAKAGEMYVKATSTKFELWLISLGSSGLICKLKGFESSSPEIA